MLHPVPLDPAALPVPLLGRLVPAGFPSPGRWCINRLSH